MSTSVVNGLAEVNLSSQLKKIMFSTSDDSVRIRVTVGGTEILNELYYPDSSGNITLYEVDELLNTYLLSTLHASVYIYYTSGDEDEFNTHGIVLYCTADLQGITQADFLAEHFLTHLRSKETNIRWREMLFYFPVMAELPVPNVTAYYDDGTNQSGDGQACTPYTINTLDVSPAQFAVPGKKLLRIVVNAGSRSMTYNVSNEEVESAPRLLFRNSFGVEETIYCVGTHQLEPEYNRTAAMVEGFKRNVAVEENKVFKAYTGALSPDCANWADDLFRSTSIHLFTERQDHTIDRGREIIITDAKAIRSNDSDFLPNFYFEYTYSQRNHNIFDEVSAGRIFDNTFDNSFN